MRWLLAPMLAILSGCAAAPSIAGFVGSGGVTLYKKATETGPKAEFVLIKFEVHHDVYTLPKEK